MTQINAGCFSQISTQLLQNQYKKNQNLSNIKNEQNYKDIFCNWADVVGTDIASKLSPHKVLNIHSQRILVVKIIDGNSIEIQHETFVLLNLINNFLKQRVFSQIKIVQIR